MLGERRYGIPPAENIKIKGMRIQRVGRVIFDVEKECNEWQRCPHCWHNDDAGLWCFAACGRYDEKGER